jgi:hypothetical protein
LSQDDIEWQVPYVMPWRFILIGGLLGVIGTYAMFTKALTNDQAAVGYLVVGILCVFVAMLSLMAAWLRTVAPSRIALTPEGILLPKWQMWCGEILIPYSSIQSVQQHYSKNLPSIRIIHEGGRSKIVSNRFTPDQFEEVYARLTRRIKQAKTSG